MTESAVSVADSTRSSPGRMLGTRLRRALARGGRRLRARSVAILMYHGVSQEPLPIYHECQVTLAEFEEQIGLLADVYRILPLSEIVSRLAANQPLPKYAAGLTFDDGFRNVLTTAYPVLRRFQVPATVFLVTGLVETCHPPWPDRVYLAIANCQVRSLVFQGHEFPLETAQQRRAAFESVVTALKALPSQEKERQLNGVLDHLNATGLCASQDSPLAMLSWPEIEALQKTGLVAFGAHTHTHEILARCPLSQQRHEIETSAEILRQRLGSVETFAYPNGQPGDFTESTKQIVQSSGLRCALTTVKGLNRPKTDVFELRRITVGRHMPLWHFEQRLAGL